MFLVILKLTKKDGNQYFYEQTGIDEKNIHIYYNVTTTRGSIK